MSSSPNQKQKIALVYSSLPAIDEIDQFKLLYATHEISVVTSESICGFLAQNSLFKDLTCVALPDHDENTTFLPGLEAVLTDYDIVIVKERLGLYAYQIVKAKWRNRFRLIVWIDNLSVFPAQDVDRMRTVRNEATNAADAFIVQSECARQTLLLEGIEEQRIIKMLPWVDGRAERTKKNRSKALELLGLSEGDLVIAHFGSLEWEDGLLDLVHGAKLAIAKDPSLGRRLKLVFCSIGSFATQIRERIIALGMDSNAIYLAPTREATQALLVATDSIFFSGIEALDRADGDPYRLLLAMTLKIPVIAPRSPIVEEFIGKHRLDFCQGSASSAALAIEKALTAKALTNNIVTKNKSVADSLYSREIVTQNMIEMIDRVQKKSLTTHRSDLDQRVLEVEAKVANKQYLEAIDLIDSIFQIQGIPTHHKSNLYRLIGDSFTKLGDSDASKSAYAQAIELDPFSARAYIGLGTAAMTKSQYETAVIYFQKAITLAPQDEMANLGLGLAFQGLEELKEAGKWIIKSLDINPDNTAAIFSLVKIAHERLDYTEAERALENYITRHPGDNNMIYSLAGILFSIAKFERVIELLVPIIAIDPMDSRAQSLLRNARHELRKKDEGTSVG
jgi:tetratricopeptide (TPR) repeat protein